MAAQLLASDSLEGQPLQRTTTAKTDGVYLRVGSDCSGMCSEILALELLLTPNTKMAHCFASDREAWIRSFIRLFFPDVGTIYGDMHERPTADMPHVHIYHAGFPCTPFSRNGNMDGVADSNGHALFPVYRYIAQVLPSSFILENVSTLPTEFPETFFS